MPLHRNIKMGCSAKQIIISEWYLVSTKNIFFITWSWELEIPASNDGKKQLKVRQQDKEMLTQFPALNNGEKPMKIRQQDKEMITQFPAVNDGKIYIYENYISPEMNYVLTWASITNDFKLKHPKVDTLLLTSDRRGRHQRDRLVTLRGRHDIFLWKTQVGAAGFEPGTPTWLAWQSGALPMRYTSFSIYTFQLYFILCSPCLKSSKHGFQAAQGLAFLLPNKPEASHQHWFNPWSADYIFVNHFFSILNHHKCLSQLFPIHLNTYVMGIRPLEIFLLLQCVDRL